MNNAAIRMLFVGIIAFKPPKRSPKRGSGKLLIPCRSII
jgi:hypothetical protein